MNIKGNIKIKQGMIRFFGVICLLCIIWITLITKSISKSQMFLSIVSILVLAGLIYVFVKKNLKFYQYVFIFLVSVGLLSGFTQPIVNIPDEYVHFARAEMLSRGKLFLNPSERSYKVDQSVNELAEDLGKPYKESKLKDKKLGASLENMEHVATTNLFFVYIPQAVGIIVAKIFNLNVMWSLWLARIFNLFIYALLVATVIKIISHFELIIFFISALPISVQQAASCSPDALINGLVIALVGYFIVLYQQQNISEKQIIRFVFLSLLSTCAKITNIFFAGLILLLPINKGKVKNRIIKVATVAFVVIIGAVYYFYTTKFVVPDIQKVYLDTIGANSTLQIQNIIEEPLRWSYNFGRALIYNFGEYMKMLSVFGQLEYTYPILSTITIFMFGKLCFQEKRYGIKNMHKCLIALMIMGNYIFVCLALYITWTPVGSPYINGVQGRYFIPMLTMLPLLFANESENGRKQIENTNDITIMTIMVGMLILSTIMRYY